MNDLKIMDIKIPKKIVKLGVISISIFWIVTIVLAIILGFEITRKILGFASSIIGLPAALINLFGIIFIIDDNKLINRTLIEAGKKDQEEWEKNKKQMEQGSAWRKEIPALVEDRGKKVVRDNVVIFKYYCLWRFYV